MRAPGTRRTCSSCSHVEPASTVNSTVRTWHREGGRPSASLDLQASGCTPGPASPLFLSVLTLLLEPQQIQAGQGCCLVGEITKLPELPLAKEHPCDGLPVLSKGKMDKENPAPIPTPTGMFLLQGPQVGLTPLDTCSLCEASCKFHSPNGYKMFLIGSD